MHKPVVDMHSHQQCRSSTYIIVLGQIHPNYVAKCKANLKKKQDEEDYTFLQYVLEKTELYFSSCWIFFF